MFAFCYIDYFQEWHIGYFLSRYDANETVGGCELIVRITFDCMSIEIKFKIPSFVFNPCVRSSGLDRIEVRRGRVAEEAKTRRGRDFLNYSEETGRRRFCCNINAWDGTSRRAHAPSPEDVLRRVASIHFLWKCYIGAPSPRSVSNTSLPCVSSIWLAPNKWRQSARLWQDRNVQITILNLQLKL